METQKEIQYNKEDILETPQTMEVTVIELAIKKGKEIFINKEGTVKTDDPEKEFLVLYVQNGDYNFKRDYHIAKYPAGKVPDSSNLGKFIKRYGKLETGMKLSVIKNTEGFYDLIY